MNQWTLVDNGWFTSELGNVCQEEDTGWYFYPKHGDWVNIPYGPRFITPLEASRYADSRREWL